MSKLFRSLRLKEKTSMTEKEPETKCEKCGKRPATDQDGLCDHCRFEGVLTGIVKER